MTLLPSILSRDRSLPALTNMVSNFFNGQLFSMPNRDISSIIWPDIDIVEDDGKYTLMADIPGVDKNDIDISVNGDTLTICGEKKEVSESRENENGYRHYERSYGVFSRSFLLPEYVDRDDINAAFSNGVLELTLKKTGEPKTPAKKIAIT